MGRNAKVLGCVAGLVLAIGAGWTIWRLISRSGESEICQACRREVHAGTRSRVSIGGKWESYCCPACAVTDGRQRGARVDSLILTDFASGRAVAAAKAILVKGSDVNPCTAHAQAHIDEAKHAMETRFDRCSPSLLAFAREDQAASFAASHGGRVITWREALDELNSAGQ